MRDGKEAGVSGVLQDAAHFRALPRRGEMPILPGGEISLPEWNGFAMADANPGRARVLVVDDEEINRELTDRASKLEGLKAGASDFLSKPVDPVELGIRMQNLLKVKEYQDFLRDHNRILERRVAERTKLLQDAIRQVKRAHRKVKQGCIEIVHCLVVAAEYRDDNTGAHIKRISHYSEVLARHLGLSAKESEVIAYASPMHDVVKIGIPDSILLKPGRLTPEEFEVMKAHTTIGAKILQGSSSAFLRMAGAIALNHHERWDGTGYPNGLKGKSIPIEAQIVHLADQYDALRSKRSYKPAFDHRTSYQILTEGDGRTMPHHFNPDILQAFKDCAMEFEGIFEILEE